MKSNKKKKTGCDTSDTDQEVEAILTVTNASGSIKYIVSIESNDDRNKKAKPSE